jgi:hypothetical protein
LIIIIESLSENSVKFVSDEEEKEIDFDVFVITFGGRPLTFVPLEVPTYRTGDAVKVSKIVEAVRDRHVIGVSI